MKKKTTQFVIALVFVILGFLLAYQYKQLKDPVRKLTVQETEDLLHEIELIQKEKENLKTENSKLQEDLKSYEEGMASESAINRTLKEELDKTRLILGLVDVKGPGLVITLSPTDPVLNPGTFEYLTDLELVYIINELKFAGAEAISINDQRLSLQTGIQSSANNSYILLSDFKISPKEAITIKAIGDKNKLHSAMSFNGAMDYNALIFYDIRFQPENELILQKIGNPLSTSFITEEETP